MPKIKINDTQLYYESHGQGPPLLLLHGLGSSTQDWELQIPAFSPAFRVLAVDIRGHGQSDKPSGPYSVAQFSNDVAALLQSLETGPVHVLGLSMGGGIAFQLAVDHPQLVRSLIIVNSAPGFKPKTWLHRVQAWQRLALIKLFGMQKIGDVLAKKLFPMPEQTTLRQIFKERWQHNDPRAYLEATRALLRWDISDHIHEITAPALIVSADNDYLSVPAKRAYAAQMPHARVVVIPNSHHALPVERPQAFNQAALDFLLSNQ